MRAVLALGGVPQTDLPDGVQQVRLRLLERAAKGYEAPRDVSAWAAVVASNLAMDWHRAKRRSQGERSRARDRDLLALLAAGRTTDEIAERLGIAPKTVRNRTSLLYRRLGVRSRAQAAIVAEERGLLD